MVPDVWPPLIQGIMERLDDEESLGKFDLWSYFKKYALTIRFTHLVVCPECW